MCGALVREEQNVRWQVVCGAFVREEQNVRWQVVCGALVREERDVRWQVVCGAFQVFYACVLMLNKEFSYAILTFRGPCIMIYSYNKSQ